MSELSTLEELEVLVICEDCGSNTEWKDCEKHPEGECYRVECLACCWTERDCDTTEHCEIIK
jgi:hypothetical protein